MPPPPLCCPSSAHLSRTLKPATLRIFSRAEHATSSVWLTPASPMPGRTNSTSFYPWLGCIKHPLPATSWPPPTLLFFIGLLCCQCSTPASFAPYWHTSKTSTLQTLQASCPPPHTAPLAPMHPPPTPHCTTASSPHLPDTAPLHPRAFRTCLHFTLAQATRRWHECVPMAWKKQRCSSLTYSELTPASATAGAKAPCMQHAPTATLNSFIFWREKYQQC